MYLEYLYGTETEGDNYEAGFGIDENHKKHYDPMTGDDSEYDDDYEPGACSEFINKPKPFNWE